MAAKDDLYANITIEILNLIRRIRVEASFDDPNFLPGQGESFYSAFLRMIGLIEYPSNVEDRISIEQRIEQGRTLVAQLLKPKNAEVVQRRLLFRSFLLSFQAQLEKYVRDVGLAKIKRIRKQIGSPIPDPRTDSRIPKVPLTGDIAEDIKTVNQQLKQYNLQRNGIGQLIQEIDLLASFTANLNAVVRSVFQDSTGGSQPLGPAGGPFISLIRAQTSGYAERLDRLVDQRAFLNAQLFFLQRKMRLIRTGERLLTRESMSLLSIVDALIYLFSEVSYTCKECKFYSTEPLETDSVVENPHMTDVQRAFERRQMEEARRRSEQMRDALRQGDETGFCTYRAVSLPTIEKGSCFSVWNLPGNDYWLASDSAEDGREDIVSIIREKLDPRKR